MISAISAADIAFIVHVEFKVRLVTKPLVYFTGFPRTYLSKMSLFAKNHLKSVIYNGPKKHKFQSKEKRKGEGREREERKN